MAKDDNAAMTRSLRTGASLAIVIGLALSGCGEGSESGSAGPQGASSGANEPAATPSAECVNPPRDLLTLINQIDPVACYGDDPLTVDAQVSGVGAIDCAPIEPAWLGCTKWVQLQPVPGQRAVTGNVLAATSGPPGLPWMFAAIHPETALDASGIMDRTLRITGHYDDPAAQTCRQTEPIFDQDTPPPPELLIPGCRATFVMTGFEQL